jgi:hypothetical protein
MLPTRAGSIIPLASAAFTAAVTQSSPDQPGSRARKRMSGRSTKYPFWLNTDVLYVARVVGTTN